MMSGQEPLTPFLNFPSAETGLAEAYASPTIEPPLSQWTCEVIRLADPELQHLRDAARARLLTEATEWTVRLQGVARQCEVSCTPDPAVPPSHQPLLMTGHQPVVFHSGIVFKYDVSQSFADRHKCVVVNVLIDTDEGDAGGFLYPATSDPAAGNGRWPGLQTAEASWSCAQGLHSHSVLKPAGGIQEVSQRVLDQLRRTGCADAAAVFEPVAAAYRRFAGRKTLLANTAIRRAAGIAPRMLEIPLSVICRSAEVQQLWRGILDAPMAFAECCNSTLQAYRDRHGIRNDVNPFPSLRVSGSDCELPFWAIDRRSGRRQIPDTRTAARGLTEWDHDVQWIPRGPLISATLRLLFADLFVHGTGGGSYDRFTDELIRAWWKVEPPPFAVASGSRYLFVRERSEYSRLDEVASRIRELQYHPQRYFGTGVFPEAAEAKLAELVKAKQEAVALLQRARAGRNDGREPARRIQVLADEIRETVATALDAVLTARQQVTDAQRAAWNNRMWPWFFFRGLNEESRAPGG